MKGRSFMSNILIRRGRIAADVFGKHYTTVFNAASRDRRLSRRARGLLGELLSHQEGFVISMAAILAGGPEGRDAVRTALKELEKHEYLKRNQDHRGNGTFDNVVWEISDAPDGLEGVARFVLEAEQEKKRRSAPVPENPPTVDPSTGETPIEPTDSPAPALTCDDAPFKEETPRSAPLPEKPLTVQPSPVDPLHKKNNFKEDQAFVPAGRKKTPHSSSVVVREPVADAGGPVTDPGASGSAEPHRDRPQERPGGREEIPSSNETRGPVVDQESAGKSLGGPVGVPGAVQTFVATLPGMNGPQAAFQGPLLPLVAAAFASGWSEGALRAEMAVKVDVSAIRSPHAVPGLYVRHLGGLGAPPAQVASEKVPLCANLAHHQQPTPDPVNGGCLQCNLAAARAQRPDNRVPAARRSPVDCDGDAFSAGAVLKAQIRGKRINMGSERSRKQTPAQRASDEAVQNRSRANSLLQYAN